MRENTVKRTLAAGGIAVGTMVVEFATPGIARLAARAGADFVLFDMEHWHPDGVPATLREPLQAGIAGLRAAL